MDVVRGLPGAHVADQCPSCCEPRFSGGSPLENELTTDPVRIAEPQSSNTFTSIAAGQAAGAMKFDPSKVKTGSSFDGVQVGVAAGVDNNPSNAADGFS